MLRHCTSVSIAVPLGAIVLKQQRRSVRYANIQETLKPIAGQSAGQMSILNDICCNPDAEEERRKPVFRPEVAPHAPSLGKAAKDPYLRNMHEWGYNSLTLFKKTNEDPGPWWNANASTLVSNWSQVGDYANAGMWSGVWRYTYGVGEYNLRPYEARGRAWGSKDPKTGAVAIHYGAISGPTQRFMFPHTPEHAQHNRLRNPLNAGVQEIAPLHGKRVMREVQYHLGQGLRFYLIDGIFGSDVATSTPYRIITDNPTHAYFASIAAIRKFNYVAQQEIMLVKRVTQSPIDEWGWRRPGVLVYHAPSFDFEKPRIVEEFGGPRPSDMGLASSKFVAVEPYSIPMKAIIGGEPSCDTLLDTTAFLCARWGFYADERGFLTLPGESILGGENELTLVVSSNEADSDMMRASPYLYGSRHHRIANGIVSRCWDVTSFPLKAELATNAASVALSENDVIETDLHRVQKPLPVRMGLPQAYSHRMRGLRHVSGFGFKWPHNYTRDVVSKAYAGGHLFKQQQKDLLAGHLPRPTRARIEDVHIIIVGNEKDAAEAIMRVLKDKSFLYAEEPALKDALMAALEKAKSVKVIPEVAARPIIEKLAREGHQ